MVFNLFSDKETACYLIAWQYACPVYVNCHKRTIYVALLWQQYKTNLPSVDTPLQSCQTLF